MTEEEVFLAALDLTSPSERAAYLEKACGGDVQFRRQVEALLAAHFKTGAFLDEPVGKQLEAGWATPIDTSPTTPHANRVGAAGAGEKKPEEPNDLRFLQPATRPDSLGRIGHYEVLQVLGKGGFGIVFRAFDDVLQRVVALKVLAPELATTSPARKRFLREARAAAQVRHENVVQIYAVEEQPLPYLVMEFIPGETLQQRLDRTGPLDVPEIVRLGRQIAQGLSAAHEKGLIHRDIKPANVLIEGGQHRVKITDFGLARAADDASMTQSGVLAGTPMYMAPEQAQGDSLDHRADLFSLGSVLYMMASGRPPFRAANTYAVLKRVVEDDPRPIQEVIPEVPAWLCDIIAKLHAKKPEDRFQSAREVADVLADCEAQLQANAALEDYSRIPQIKPAAVRSGRWLWVAAATLVLAVLALVMTEITGITHWLQNQQQPDPLEKGDGDRVRREQPEDQELRTYFTNTLGMKFKLIPAGRFTMGSSREEIDRCLREFRGGSKKFQELRKRHEGAFEQERLPAEGPEHEVEITKPFYMGITEVTVGQFRQFVQAKKYDVGDDGWKKPAFGSLDDYPVVFVAWDNAVDFCKWLSAKEGKKYRLPTEAEWEYCCRAGRAGTRYCFGNKDEQLEIYAWYKDNSDDRTQRVGQLKPNAWGLYDMHGNAWEWCQDNYDPNYYKRSSLKDPPGGAGAERAVRGGSWYWSPEFCRSAFRQFVSPGQRYSDLGFRVLLVAPPAGSGKRAGSRTNPGPRPAPAPPIASRRVRITPPRGCVTLGGADREVPIQLDSSSDYHFGSRPTR
jgi:formylglycine-generating enzyme required for sulfatase activity